MSVKNAGKRCYKSVHNVQRQQDDCGWGHLESFMEVVASALNPGEQAALNCMGMGNGRHCGRLMGETFGGRRQLLRCPLPPHIRPG